jgi:hypothetical protein
LDSFTDYMGGAQRKKELAHYQFLHDDK